MFTVDRNINVTLSESMKKISTLLLIILSFNLGYSYFSLDPNLLEYGNLKFNKSLSGSDNVVSDTAVVLNEGDVMIILRFTTDRSRATLGNQYDSYQRGGLYVYTKDSVEDEVLIPVNANGYGLSSNSSPPNALTLSGYLQGTYIVGPKIVCIAWIPRQNSSFYGSNNDINCEMDYAIQRKRTVNPQPVSQ